MAIQQFIFLLALLFGARGAPQGQEPVTTISINAIAGLQYDRVRFIVKPGARVKVIFKNQDDMSHNLLFSKPGARERIVDAAIKLEERGPAMNYIPDSDDILWALPVLAPGEEKSITFTAPDSEGAYPYVCTFPGHGFSMYGAMYVSHQEKLPDIEKDLNIPPSRRKSDADGHRKKDNHVMHETVRTQHHPYIPVAPYLYRGYMENSSPAAIAVHLPFDLSYCWDAGVCELRYAWHGGFVDNAGLWKGKPNAVAKVLGTVFFQKKIMRTLRIGDPDEIPSASYKGYRLINRYPEFHYTLNGTDVYELIQAKPDGNGLIRTFRIPDVEGNVWFLAHPDDGVRYETSQGKWKSNSLLLSGAEAKRFTIVMTKAGR